MNAHEASQLASIVSSLTEITRGMCELKGQRDFAKERVVSLEKELIRVREQAAEDARAVDLAAREFAAKADEVHAALRLKLGLMEMTLAERIKERNMFLDELHHFYKSCVRCGCLLQPPNVPPHCEDCVPTDDDGLLWEARRAEILSWRKP